MQPVSALLLLSAFLLPGMALSQHGSATVGKASTENHRELKDTETFFSWFARMKSKMGPRGEFETEGEYKKRLPAPFNSAKVIYFRVEGGYSKKTHKRVSYDIDTETLTVYAGSAVEDVDIDGRNRQPDLGVATKPRTWKDCGSGTPIRISKVQEEKDSYVGTNAFGAKVGVTVIDTTEYILNVLNIGRCPADVFDKSESIFAVSIKLPPKQAEKLSENLEIILGVRLPGYLHSAMTCSYLGKPTFDRPFEFTAFEYVIDASVTEVLLRDRVTKRIYVQHDISASGQEDLAAPPPSEIPGEWQFTWRWTSYHLDAPDDSSKTQALQNMIGQTEKDRLSLVADDIGTTGTAKMGTSMYGSFEYKPSGSFSVQFHVGSAKATGEGKARRCGNGSLQIDGTMKLSTGDHYLVGTWTAVKL